MNNLNLILPCNTLAVNHNVQYNTVITSPKGAILR